MPAFARYGGFLGDIGHHGIPDLLLMKVDDPYGKD
jgi:hypothetical protein